MRPGSFEGILAPILITSLLLILLRPRRELPSRREPLWRRDGRRGRRGLGKGRQISNSQSSAKRRAQGGGGPRQRGEPPVFAVLHTVRARVARPRGTPRREAHRNFSEVGELTDRAPPDDDELVGRVEDPGGESLPRCAVLPRGRTRGRLVSLALFGGGVRRGVVRLRPPLEGTAGAILGPDAR